MDDLIWVFFAWLSVLLVWRAGQLIARRGGTRVAKGCVGVVMLLALAAPRVWDASYLRWHGVPSDRPPLSLPAAESDTGLWFFEAGGRTRPELVAILNDYREELEALAVSLLPASWQGSLMRRDLSATHLRVLGRYLERRGIRILVRGDPVCVDFESGVHGLRFDPDVGRSWAPGGSEYPIVDRLDEHWYCYDRHRD